MMAHAAAQPKAVILRKLRYCQSACTVDQTSSAAAAAAAAAGQEVPVTKRCNSVWRSALLQLA
jgi:hypothetical protein